MLKFLSHLGHANSVGPSVQSLSCVLLIAATQTTACQCFPVHQQLPELAQTHVHWVGDAIQPSHPLSSPSPSSHLQSFPGSGSFLMSQFFVASGQSIVASASASLLSVNIQDWFPLEWTGLILQSKGTLKRLLQHHSSKASFLRCSAFFVVQLSHPYMTNGKPISWLDRPFLAK